MSKVAKSFICSGCLNPVTSAGRTSVDIGVSAKLELVDYFLSRYAMHPRTAVLAMGLCLSVRLSVTSRSSTKTAKRRITQTTPHYSRGTLVICRQ